MEKKTYIIKYAKCVLVLLVCIAAFFAIRPLFWRFITRPTDQIRTYTESSERGEIFDCRDNLIATNKTVYDLHLDCCVLEDQKMWEYKSRRLAQGIALILPDKTAPEWWDYFQNARGNRNRYLPIGRNLDRTMVDSLRSLPLFNEGKYKGGLILTSHVIREYPYGNMARRTIGVWRNTSDDYLFGVERQFDDDLSGDDGIRKVKVGYRGRKSRQWEIEREDKVDGWDVYTTIYMKYQALADSVLRVAVESDEDIAGGCLVLMEVKTGGITALANCHRLDNGRIGEYYNYAISHSYEPGEVVQTMTLAAALSDGMIKSLDEKIPTNHGRLTDTCMFRDDYIIRYERMNQTDSISVIDGFAQSSRYVASALALKYVQSQDYFYKWYEAFCLTEDNFDIDGMRELDLVDPIGRDINTLSSTGSGYGFTVCPMQILSFYNTIANNGKMMHPMLIKKMTSDKYGSQYMMPREINEMVFRKEVADSLKKALTACTEHGTSKLHDGMPQNIIGKTGTSRQVIDPRLREGSLDPYQDSEGCKQYSSTFAGFFPADNPRYSIICVLFSKPTHKPIYGGTLPTAAVAKFVEGVEKIKLQ
ncbi:MAG: penicillin-binding protein 2 [Bacteroidales bacterium]|nr:penicillin-binding protein 2 [Bacteroidales bacterium]